ncbi:MAG: alanine glycine permease, partial [Egibacteraceae bacterium]
MRAWRLLVLTAAIHLVLAAPALAAEATGVDKKIQDALGPVSDAIETVVFYAVPIGGAELPLIVVWLIAGAVFFTVYLRFINLRGFRHSFDVVRGAYDDPDDPGETTHFHALITALSAT